MHKTLHLGILFYRGNVVLCTRIKYVYTKTMQVHIQVAGTYLQVHVQVGGTYLQVTGTYLQVTGTY